MITRAGYNSQFARRKYDVELDETDLDRIILEVGLDPVKVRPKLTTAGVHALLRSEAELLALNGALNTGVFDQGAEHNGAQERYQHLQRTRSALLEQFRGIYGPLTAEQPPDAGGHD